MTSHRYSLGALAVLALTVLACGPKSPDADPSTAATDAQGERLPIADSVAVRLANEASVLFGPADTFPSGPRRCQTLPPNQDSERCRLVLRPRSDVGEFGPGTLPTEYMVLAAVENEGDLTEGRTRIPAGVQAYVLIERGERTRTRGWYFAVDSGAGGRVVVISRFSYVACDHAESGARPNGAWRACSDPSPTTAERTSPLVHRHDLPPWLICSVGCCVVDV